MKITDRKQIKDILFIVLAIASKDGIISSTELNTAQKEFNEIFDAKLSDEDISQTLKEFFSSNDQLEDYLNKIEDKELRKSILQLSVICAASDGFDIKENIAYKKSLVIWNFSHTDIIKPNE